MAITENERYLCLEIKQNIGALGTDELLKYAYDLEVPTNALCFRLMEAATMALWASEEASDINPRENDVTRFNGLKDKFKDDAQKQEIKDFLMAAVLTKSQKKQTHGIQPTHKPAHPEQFFDVRYEVRDK